jgi:hypothetical protein
VADIGKINESKEIHITNRGLSLLNEFMRATNGKLFDPQRMAERIQRSGNPEKQIPPLRCGMTNKGAE